MAGFGCFCFAAATAIVCFALFLHMDKMVFYRHYTDLVIQKGEDRYC
jgi:hypothetical protein